MTFWDFFECYFFWNQWFSSQINGTLYKSALFCFISIAILSCVLKRSASIIVWRGLIESIFVDFWQMNCNPFDQNIWITCKNKICTLACLNYLKLSSQDQWKPTKLIWKHLFLRSSSFGEGKVLLKWLQYVFKLLTFMFILT